MVKVLLKLGANPAVQDNESRSPLHWATTVQSTKCLQLLCKSVAKPGAPDQASPLNAAAAAGKEKGSEREHGVFNAKDKNGMTPLLWAVTQGKERHVNVLLKFNVDLAARDNFGRSPMLSAAELDSPTCLQLLLETTTKYLEDRDQEGRTPLLVAVANQREPAVRLLLSAGADVACQDNNGHSPLHWACALANAPLVDMLLNAGADPALSDENGLNPLHYCIQVVVALVCLCACVLVCLCACVLVVVFLCPCIRLHLCFIAYMWLCVCL